MTTADLDHMSGIELLLWLQDNDRRGNDVPSVRRMTGMRFDIVEHGRVIMSLQTRPDFTNTLDTVHGGITATLLDSVMGNAVHSTLPARVSYTTLELKVNFIRPARTDGLILIATGSVLHVGRRTATAEGRVLDEYGNLVAHGTTTCIILRPGGDA